MLAATAKTVLSTFAVVLWLMTMMMVLRLLRLCSHVKVVPFHRGSCRHDVETEFNAMQLCLIRSNAVYGVQITDGRRLVEMRALCD